ncbi:MAG: flagellar biosynthesis anti-sigma factor FlgM [Tepidiformaceae bacterium]
MAQRPIRPLRNIPEPRPQRAAAAPQPGSDAMNAHVDEFRRALRIVKSTPDVRAARVAALRAQIAAGTYRPDPQEIARRIIQQGL